MDYVVPLKEALKVKIFGGKATNLSRLVRAGLPVPGGFAIGIPAFRLGKLAPDAKTDIKKLIKQDRLYAVRSSALAEDSEDASWAGLFESFLDIPSSEVIAKIEQCHNSAKDRARAYAKERSQVAEFSVAVVVQEMIKPEYAGVLFTKNPVSGKDELVCEYVKGPGEQLVSGQADPIKINWKRNEAVQAPFDTKALAELADSVERVFGQAQDIEWAAAENKIWLLQARPITATQSSNRGYYLGEPDELFYWGPSRAKPLYMSDFVAAVENFFLRLLRSPDLPNPPKTITLFYNDKNVWLINAKEFADFTKKCFEAYKDQGRFADDLLNWQRLVQKLDAQKADAPELVEAWNYALFAEFSLYGAESVVATLLQRLTPKQRQEIWGAFTLPDKPTFLAAIDEELMATEDPKALAAKYPWIDDGYRGVSNDALNYFKKRLVILKGNPDADRKEHSIDRNRLMQKYNLTRMELDALDLARKLAEFMDERKAWMMRTRCHIAKSASSVEYGWFYNDSKVELISRKDTQDLWERYIDFKASASELTGIVASNGGRHFVNGEVVVVDSPTDTVADDRILVVPASSPSYVPLMRKARAMITDHGGMMSHAAIVGREFNLPCIVGTKQATKLLKTGDKVVLDLVRGEVNR